MNAPADKRRKRARADARCALKALGLYSLLREACDEIDPDRAAVALARFGALLAEALDVPARRAWAAEAAGRRAIRAKAR